MYAALGLAIVLTYRGTGVINFAVGAMAMSVAYVFVELHDAGDFVVLVPGLPERISVGETASLPLAFALSLAFAAALGALVYFLVFRPLRNAPALAKVVASFGIMIVLQAVVVLRLGTNPRSVGPVLPDTAVEFGGITIARDRLILAAIVVATATLLWALYRFTAFGRLARATTESEKGTALLGYSPDWISGTNWVLASVIGGLIGILVSPITGLHPAIFTLFAVPALGAALVGRFTSFGLTAAAGLAIGMLQSEITNLQSTYTWLPRVGLKEGLPFIVIIAALVIAGRRLPTRGTIRESRLPFAPRPKSTMALTVGLFAATVAALVALQGSYRLALITSMIGAIICLSLVLLTGYLGQISLAQMAFAGIAGFALSKFSDQWGIPFPLAPLLAAGVATALGLLIGVPALRIRGVNLAVVTLAAGIAVEEFIFRNPNFTGGFRGSPVPSPELFGLDLGISSGRVFPRVQFGILVLVVLTLVAVAVANLRRSALGRRMLAVRANEAAAAAVGINVARTKLAGFALSAFVAGLGGALLGYQRGFLSFESFSVFVSLHFLALAYIRGITSVSGALLGGALATGGIAFTAADRWVGAGQYEFLIGGVAVIIIAVAYPEGVTGAIRHGVAALRRGPPRQPTVSPSEEEGALNDAPA